MVDETHAAQQSGDDLTTVQVARARRGDVASVESLVRRFTPVLRTQAAYRLRALGQEVDPEDLIQDVWVATLPRLPELTPRDGRVTPVLVKFLAATLRHKVYQILDARVRMRRVEPDTREWSGLADTTLATLDRVVREERDAAVHGALDTLSPDERELVVLRGIEQNSYDAIADVLHTDRARLRMRYLRALDKVRGRLLGSVFAEILTAEGAV